MRVLRKPYNDFLMRYFQSFKTDSDENVQRILDEAKLIDFLVNNGVCAVTVVLLDFEGMIYKNLENTIAYINAPSNYEMYN